MFSIVYRYNHDVDVGLSGNCCSIVFLSPLIGHRPLGAKTVPSLFRVTVEDDTSKFIPMKSLFFKTSGLNITIN